MGSELELYLNEIGLSADMLLSPSTIVQGECSTSSSQLPAEVSQEPCPGISVTGSVDDNTSNFTEVPHEIRDTQECDTVTANGQVTGDLQTAVVIPTDNPPVYTDSPVSESGGNSCCRHFEERLGYIPPSGSGLNVERNHDVTVSEEQKAASVGGGIHADCTECTMSNNLAPVSSDCCQTPLSSVSPRVAVSPPESTECCSLPASTAAGELANAVLLETNSVLPNNTSAHDDSRLPDVVTTDVVTDVKSTSAVQSTTLPDKLAQPAVPTSSSSAVDQLHHVARSPYSSTVIHCSSSSTSSVISTNTTPRDGRLLSLDDAASTHSTSYIEQTTLQDKPSPTKVEHSEAVVGQKAEVTTAANYVSVIRIGSAWSTVRSLAASSDITSNSSTNGTSSWSTQNNSRPIACVVPTSRTPQDSPPGPIKSSLKKFTPGHSKQKSVSFSTGSIEEDCPTATNDGETSTSVGCLTNGLSSDDEGDGDEGRVISDDIHEEQKHYLQTQSAKNGLQVPLGRTTVLVTSETFQTGEVQPKGKHQRNSMPLKSEIDSKKRNAKVGKLRKGEKSTEVDLRQSGQDAFGANPAETATNEADADLATDNCATISTTSQTATKCKETKKQKKMSTASKKKQCKVQ